MTYDLRNCKDFLTNNCRKFGITDTALNTEYLDICAKNVRLIASRTIDEKIVLPSMSTFLNSCTGLVDCAGGIDTQFASLRVTHAHEELVECDTNCPGVQLTIKGQIIVRTKSCNPCCPPSYMAIPVELVSEVIKTFYCASTGEKVTGLKNELPHIDGSCMVINLNCRVYREICNGCSRYIAHVQGSVVDKLWKLENVWVEGIRPYTCPAITICDNFAKDICTCWEDSDYISMHPHKECDKCCDCNDACTDNGCGSCTNGYNCCTENSGCCNNCYNTCTETCGCCNNCGATTCHSDNCNSNSCGGYINNCYDNCNDYNTYDSCDCNSCD